MMTIDEHDPRRTPFDGPASRTRLAMSCLGVAILAVQVAGCASNLSHPPPQQEGPLPAPSGAFRVGTRVLDPIADPSRADPRFARGVRTLCVQLWYPTLQIRGQRSLYVTEPALLDAMKATSTAPDVIESWRALRTHAFQNAALAPGRFPLILFSPGFGMARAFYTSWIEELVSRGFVVAAVDHPFAGEAVVDGRLFEAAPHPDGPHAQTSTMAADLRFLIPVLVAEPGVDGARVAAIGHSIGGAAALEACRLDPRFAACVNLDGDPSFGLFAETGVGRPFMVIHQGPVLPNAKPDGALATMGRELEAAWQAIIAKQSEPAVRLSVRGTGHLSFSDAPFVRPSLVTDDGGVLTDPILVLRGTSAAIAAYLRNAFAGHADVELRTPEFIRPAHLGTVN